MSRHFNTFGNQGSTLKEPSLIISHQALTYKLKGSKNLYWIALESTVTS